MSNGNKTDAGLWRHDWTPACWGMLGRRGSPGALNKARGMMDGKPERDKKWGSDNHHLIQAMNNAAAFGEYSLARSFFEERALKHGLGEGGPLYFGAGDTAPVFVILKCAEEDKEMDVARMARGYLSWLYSQVCIPLHVGNAPKRILSIIPSGEYDYHYTPTGKGHAFMPGSRAMFGPPGGAGWYSENPLSLVYQWMADAPGRTLPNRYANYEIKGHENTWDCWAWLIAVTFGLIPARKKRNAKALKRAFREKTITPLETTPMDVKLKFGMEILGFENGSKLITCSHPTAGPKPPVNWIDYHAPSGDLTVCAPDGLIAYGSKGRGRLERSGGKIWAVASTPDREIPSRKYRIEDVVSHQELPPKAAQWRDGDLHPKSEPPAPPVPPQPEKPKEEKKRPWYERLWKWFEDLL